MGAQPDPAVDHAGARHRRRLYAPHAHLDARGDERGLPAHGAGEGAEGAKIVYRQGLRAASTPIVTQFGIDVGALIGGAVITEQVFGLPGLGYTAVHAIEQQDLPVIIGIVLVASAGVVVANILVDLFYAVLDPRVRASTSRWPRAPSGSC